MENFALVGLVENLKPAFADLVIRRVVQHQPNGFIFQTRSPKFSAFKVLMESQCPAIYLSENRPPIESPNDDFLMVLRKHLTSAELASFSKPLSERIVEFVFKTAVPSKELETMSLVLELLPNAGNLILLDAERRVLSSFLPITPQHGIGEYDTYSFPKAGDKIDLERVMHQDIPELQQLETTGDAQSWLISNVAGIGPVFAAEVLHRHRKTGAPIVDEIRTLIEQVKSPSRGAWLYTDLPLSHILERNDLKRLSRGILSPVQLGSLERSHSSKSFGNILEAAKFFFDELENHTLLENAKLPILRDLREAARRLSDREKRLTREQKKYEEAEGIHKVGQMLASSGKTMDQHYDSVTVTDYFQEEPRQVNVTLDATVSLRENIERMFKRHQKADRGKGIVSQQLGQVRHKRTALEEQMRRLQAIRDWDTWLAIASKIHLQKGGAVPTRGEEGGGRKRSARNLKIDDYEILIGRSSRENDEITFHAAGPEDFWFHVADYSGSHVIVRNPGKEKDLNEAVLLKAAQLAAYFSQARNSSKVDVHYTKRKHVTKPRKAKAGMVRLIEFKSIKVEPKNWIM